MPEPPPDLDAPEAFVADNDRLAELERRVGRFNLFDAPGEAHRELSRGNPRRGPPDPGAAARGREPAPRGRSQRS